MPVYFAFPFPPKAELCNNAANMESEIAEIKKQVATLQKELQRVSGE